MHSVHIRQANNNDLDWIKSFLKENGLTTIGVDDWCRNFVVAQNENGLLIGTAGVELYGDAALLRSVAVRKGSRNMGFAKALVDAVLKNVEQKHVGAIYLFTENAESFFKRLGFEVVESNEVDEAVRASPELVECCERAVAMRKLL